MRALIPIAALLLACNKDKDGDSAKKDDTGELPPEAEESCTPRSDPGTAMITGRNPDTTSPAIMVGGPPATVTIEPDRANYIRFEAPAAGSYVLWTDPAGVFLAIEKDRVAIEAPIPEANPACPEEIAEGRYFELSEAGTWFIKFRWSGDPQAWVYLEQLESAE